jgi:D-threo-aldose 1-dehydrogenase
VTAMIQRHLGRTGLDVSILGLGAAPLADLFREVPESQAVDTIRTALDDGITLIDTAPKYGAGKSEERLGMALADVPREEFVLATKVGWDVQPGERPTANFTRDGVLRGLEDSLERLRLDHVDIVHIHDPDHHYEEAIGQVYPVLDELRSQGVIKAVSAGMNQWQMLMDFLRDGDFDCFMLAGRYTLLEQGAIPLLDECARRNVGILAAGVFNSGILATGAVEGAKYNYRDAPPEIIERVSQIEEVCEAHGIALATAALQFPLGHPAVSSLVIGFSSPDRVEKNLRNLNTIIPDGLWTDLRKNGLLAESCPVPG